MSYGTVLPIAVKGEAVKENRAKILYKTLNLLKNGFYSRNKVVQANCGSLFVELLKSINYVHSELAVDAWEWFTTSTQAPEFKRSPTKGVNFKE